MYRILADDKELWSPIRGDIKIGAPTLSLELNTIGSLTFKLLPNHPLYDELVKMKTIITVYQDSRIIFKGRIYSDTADFYKTKTVEVEGVLGYLNDSIVRPYSYRGSVEAYLRQLIKQHNDQVEKSQRFIVGNVTVEATETFIRESSEYPTTWSEISTKLIEAIGGYIVIRYEEDGNYIDYLKDMSDTSTQTIAFGVNLLDIEKQVKSDSLATCIIPLGCQLEGDGNKRLDIKRVNNNVDYVYDADAVKKYGKVFEVVTWDDVNTTGTLLAKAKERLKTSVNLTQILKLKAVDLHLTDKTIETFKLGDYINLLSSPHGIYDKILLKAYKLDLSNPQSCTIEADSEKMSFVDTQMKNNSNTTAFVKKMSETITDDTLKKLNDLNGYDEKITNAKTEAIADTTEKLKAYYTSEETNAQIQASQTTLKSEFSKTYTTKAEFEDEMQNYSTTTETKSLIKQSADSINLVVAKKVDDDKVISAINQSAEKITINADKIDLNGAVTANNYFTIGKDGEVTIRNGSIDLTSDAIGFNSKTKIDSDGLITEQSASGLTFDFRGNLFSGLLMYPSGKSSLSGYNCLKMTRDRIEMSKDVVRQYDAFIEISKETSPYSIKVQTASDTYSSITAKAITTKGSLSCYGTKNRIVETEHYGEVKLNALESPTPSFMDYGEGQLDEFGYCRIYLDDKFVETLDTDTAYTVFVTKYGQGDIWVDDRQSDYVDIKGEPKLKFSWQVIATQKGYNAVRLDENLDDSVDSFNTDEIEQITSNFINEWEEY